MKKILVLIVFIFKSCESGVSLTLLPIYNNLHRAVGINHKSHLGGGFFNEFGVVIANLIHYEQDGIKSVYVDWTDEFFPFKNELSENGWDLYFEPIQVDKVNENEPIYHVGSANTHVLHDQLCIAPWLRYNEYFPYRQFAHTIIKKYIRIKPHILNKVNEIYTNKMQGHICIGVHVRYADAHASEAPGGHPSLEAYCTEVNKLLNMHAHQRVKIFLASDSRAVIKFFKKKYQGKLIYLKTHRAKGKEDPSLLYENSAYWTTHPQEWHKAKPGYQGGLGVLMDCLLLSSCDYFIHTTSNVATYVSFFNPYIKSIYLPHGVPFKHCRYRNDPSIRNKYLNPI